MDPLRTILGLALTASLLLVASAPARAQEPAEQRPAEIVVKGSDTIGEHLGQALARAYMEKAPGVAVRWESIGSSSAFVGLLDGSAVMGASSRAIRPAELERASELGIELGEYVLGYDGIAVIVHPSNPIDEVDLAQLVGLFTERRPRWTAVGGAGARVRRLSRPSYSGTHAFFKQSVLVAVGGAGAEFAPETEFIEETDAIVREVATDPYALSYVGLGFVDPAQVKVLRVARAAGSPGVLPEARSIRDGTYPIYRPLFLYTRRGAPESARRLLRFALSERGRALVAASDFVPPDAAAAPDEVVALAVASVEMISLDLASVPPAPAAGGGELVRVPFEFSEFRVGPEVEALLRPVLERLRAGGYRVSVIGHSDSTGPVWANRWVSRARAERVAAFLLQRGVSRDRIDVQARASDEPVASNLTREGRIRNRRVELILIPLYTPS